MSKSIITSSIGRPGIIVPDNKRLTVRHHSDWMLQVLQQARRVRNNQFEEIGLTADGCKVMAGRRGCMVQLFVLHVKAYGCKNSAAV